MNCSQEVRDNIRSVLVDTIKMVVRNGLSYRSGFNVEGLLGITVDNSQVFLVSINELVQSSESSQLSESHVDIVDNKPDAADHLPSATRPGQRAKKRKHVIVDRGSSSSDEDGDHSTNNLTVTKRNGPANQSLSSSQPPVDIIVKPETEVYIPESIRIKTEEDSAYWMQAENENELDCDGSDEQQSSSYNSSLCYGLSRECGILDSDTVYNPIEMQQINKAKGGRPMDEVWQYYTRLEDNGRLQALCKVCGKRVSAKVGRLREHLKKCQGLVLPKPKSQEERILSMLMESSHRIPDPMVHNVIFQRNHRNLFSGRANPACIPDYGYLDTGKCVTSKTKQDFIQDYQLRGVCQQYIGNHTENNHHVDQMSIKTDCTKQNFIKANSNQIINKSKDWGDAENSVSKQ